jgi:hypothetical protein
MLITTLSTVFFNRIKPVINKVSRASGTAITAAYKTPLNYNFSTAVRAIIIKGHKGVYSFMIALFSWQKKGINPH